MILQANFTATSVVDTTATTSVAVVTDTSWRAFDATPYYNPSGNTGGAYQAPQENIDAALFPGDWTMPNFDSSKWDAAVVVASFGFEILPKVPTATFASASRPPLAAFARWLAFPGHNFF